MFYFCQEMKLPRDLISANTLRLEVSLAFPYFCFFSFRVRLH